MKKRHVKTISLLIVLMAAYIALCASIAHAQTPVIGANAGTGVVGSTTGTVVLKQTPVIESAPSAVYATVYTTPSAGIYRITGTLYATTASTSACTVQQFVSAQSIGQSGPTSFIANTETVGTSVTNVSQYPVQFNLAAGVNIQTQTVYSSGTCAGASWTRFVVIEKL